MKRMSVRVPDRDLQELRSMAAATGRPVAEMIRQAVADYIEKRRRASHSLCDLAPHPSGRLLRPWTRTEIMNEMRYR